MKANGGGRIINIASQMGIVANAEKALYGLTKAALIHLTKSMAFELAAHNITVNAVSPLCSDEATLFGQFPPEGQKAVKEWADSGWSPMRRLATPADVANACALLCSEEASFVTGQSITVDGGSSLMNPDFPLALQVPK